MANAADEPESRDSQVLPRMVLALVGILGLSASLWWMPRLGTMLFVLAVIYGLLMGLGLVLGALREE